jgi:hypothetical protein
MTTLREAAAQALDALTKIHPGNMSWETGEAWMNAVQILREALAQPEPEPVAWMIYTLDGASVCVTDSPSDFTSEYRALPIYATPPQRKPLTDAEITELLSQSAGIDVKLNGGDLLFARAIERAHGIGEKE